MKLTTLYMCASLLLTMMQSWARQRCCNGWIAEDSWTEVHISAVKVIYCHMESKNCKNQLYFCWLEKGVHFAVLLILRVEHHASQKEKGPLCCPQQSHSWWDKALFCEGKCQVWLHRCCVSVSSEQHKLFTTSTEPFLCPTFGQEHNQP